MKWIKKPKPVNSPANMNTNHHLASTKYAIVDVRYDTPSQNKIVPQNFFLVSSPLAVATAAKQGIVVILNMINAINTGQPVKPEPVIPVALAVAIADEVPPSSSEIVYTSKYVLICSSLLPPSTFSIVLVDTA